MKEKIKEILNYECSSYLTFAEISKIAEEIDQLYNPKELQEGDKVVIDRMFGYGELKEIKKGEGFIEFEIPDKWVTIISDRCGWFPLTKIKKYIPQIPEPEKSLEKKLDVIIKEYLNEAPYYYVIRNKVLKTIRSEIEGLETEHSTYFFDGEEKIIIFIKKEDILELLK